MLKRILYAFGWAVGSCFASLVGLWLFHCFMYLVYHWTGFEFGGLIIVLPFVAGFIILPLTVLGGVIGFVRGGGGD